MLTDMEKKKVKAAVDKLRTDTDPKFRKELSAVADSFDALIDAATVMGRKGGTARAKKLSKKRRSEIARAAAKARWSK